MRGELTYKILEAIEKAGFATADLIDVFTSGYSESYRKARRIMMGHRKHRKSWMAELKEEQKFYSLLTYLQKQGLVLKERNNKNSIWKITRKGEEKLRKLKERLLKRPPMRNYPFLKATFFTIVSFDIPEFNRKQRDWLRDALKRLDYKMIQKSVWIGKAALPIEFLEDLKNYKILNYVHIFTIGKKGTISNFKF